MDQPVGIDGLINRKGTTWRRLDDVQKEKVKDEVSAIGLMANHTSLIKRPIIERNGEMLTIGFDEEEYVTRFNQ